MSVVSCGALVQGKFVASGWWCRLAAGALCGHGALAEAYGLGRL